MEFITQPKVTIFDLITAKENGTIPLVDQIGKIYLGYRQCYSKNPWKVKELEPSDHAALREKWMLYMKDASKVIKKYASEPKELYIRKEGPDGVELVDVFDHLDTYFEMLLAKYGYKEYFQFLHMCSFIRKHKAHESPLEHGIMTVQIEDCSRSLTHQHVRHRICSHSQQSQRYCGEDPELFRVIVPPTVAKNARAMEAYKEFLAALSKATKVMQEEKLPNEDMRYMYPNGLATAIVTTMNFRAWKHYCYERSCSRAQWEIRSVANAIRAELMYAVPFVFEDLGPKCVSLGYCPEHQGCGYMPAKSKFLKSE